ncbi:MAG: hypothetical protein LUI14_05915 [Lachnospiraceae bacterium]|nr:hypothetical protein [Lachnospiraceae bacterium]MCD7765503.1 hypothetical protein [Lachnospiraceae bacterium]
MAAERYMIDKDENGCLIARYDGNGRHYLWGTGSCKWEEDNKGIALRACCGFDDDFYPISKEEAQKVIGEYKRRKDDG